MDTALQPGRGRSAGLPVRALILAVAASLTLTACGGGGTPGGDTASTAESGDTATQEKLYDIARKGNTAEFDITWDLVQTKDVNAPDPRTGQSMIHYAADNRTSPLMIHTVLTKGADPNLKDKAGLTPMRHAIMSNNQVAIRNLMIRSQDLIASGRVAPTPDIVPVRTDIAGPDGKTDLETCQGFVANGMQHRGCAVMMEMLSGGNLRSSPEQVQGVLHDLDQARQQSDLQ